MPYASVADLPDGVKKGLSPKQQRQWLDIFNSALKRCKTKGGDDKKCESGAFAQANGVVKHAVDVVDAPGATRATFAAWDTAYINDLPDASFLFVEPGGKKDGEGKTTPRSKRHLPVKDAGGKVDLAHLRNAITRLGQADTLKGVVSEGEKASLQRKAQAMLNSAHSGGDAAYAGGIATFDLGPISPLYVSEDGIVYRPGTIFRAGEYPDKAYAMTPDEIRAAAEAFGDPVPVDLEHTETPLSGQLGEVVSLTASDDGAVLEGIVAIPDWLDKILPHRKVSATWDRETKKLVGLALTNNPRVSDAALMAAFSIDQATKSPEALDRVLAEMKGVLAEFAPKRHDTPQGQGLLQQIHDITAMRGATCDPKNAPGKKAEMHSSHEGKALQSIHDMTTEHGAVCQSIQQANSPGGSFAPGTYPSTSLANSPAWPFTSYSAGPAGATTVPAKKEGRRMSKLEEFFRKLLEGDEGDGTTPTPAPAPAPPQPVAASTGSPAAGDGTRTAEMSEQDRRMAEMQDENRRLRAENDRILSERVREQAVAFADSIIRDGRALPVEREQMIAAYVESATDDLTVGPAHFNLDGKEVVRPRVESLKALYAVRPAHMLTTEQIGSTLHQVLASQAHTPDPDSPKPASPEDLERLIGSTPLGASALAREKSARNGSGGR